MKRFILVLILNSFAFAGVSTTNNRMPLYSCNGATTDFTFDFPIINTSDVNVVLVDSTGTQSNLVEDSDYTVSAVNNDYSTGGTITTTSTYASGYQILISRNVPITQETTLISDSGILRTKSVVDTLDKQVMISQDMFEILSRCIKYPISEPNYTVVLPKASSRANKGLGFDEYGELYLGSFTIFQITDSNITAFWKERITTDNNLSEAQTALGIGDSNNLYYGVNVKDFGAAGDDVTDDTNAFLKAKWFLSSITTTIYSDILANFTVGTSSFDNENAYIGGGKIIAPAGIYKIHGDKFFLDSYVMVEGDGHEGNAYKDVNNAKATIIHVVDGTVGIGMTGFSDTTGERWPAADCYVSVNDSNISYTFGSQLRDLTVYCEPNVHIGVKIARGNCFSLSDVSVLGEPNIGIAETGSWYGNYHNINVTGKTISHLATKSTGVVSYSGYFTALQKGTAESILPFYCTDAMTDSNNTSDKFQTYSTGVYFVLAGNRNFQNLAIENDFNRAMYSYGTYVKMEAPYIEGITNQVFGISVSPVIIESPTVNCEDANAFYCQGQSAKTNAKLIGQFRSSSYNALIDGGIANETGTLILDVPYNVFTSQDDPPYDWVQYKDTGMKNLARITVIDQIAANLNDSDANIVGLWIFNPIEGTAITDRTVNGHNLTSSVNINTRTLVGWYGLCPYINFAQPTAGYFDLADDSNFTFGDGSTDTPFSVVWMGNVDWSNSYAICGKENGTTGAFAKEWKFQMVSDGLQFKLTDNDACGTILTTTGDLTGDDDETHTYIATYDGGGVNTGLAIYRDGVAESVTAGGTGSYTAMENLTAKFGSYYTDAAGTKFSNPCKNMVLIIIKRQLTQAEITALDELLRSYAGFQL